MREMLVEQQDVFYYITLMNENYAQPALVEGSSEAILRGGYRFARYDAESQADAGGAGTRNVTLLGSGAILTEVIKAAQELARMGIAADVLSITSWSELARDGERHQSARLRGAPIDGHPFITGQLAACKGPVIAATDYVRLVPESIRAYIPPGREYITLGTDGFGRSDTRAELRRYFGVDAEAIVNAALVSLA